VCGRYTSRTSAGDLAAYFGADDLVGDDLGPRYNVAPTDEVYLVAESKEHVRRLGTARWGLVPFWADGPTGAAKLINVRAETLLGRSTFRRTFERRRCLVPADGFYEWETQPGSKQRVPWHFSRVDHAPFAFAGLWEAWHPPDGGDRLVSCSIITTRANEVVAPLHDRMPVVLEPDAWEAWLDVDGHDVEALQSLLVPAGDGVITRTRASKAVNNVRNDGPELLEPDDDSAAPEEPTLLSPEPDEGAP
jgi:putative SOS response-associated peptidase YedK